jgi:hypothetical protein
VHAIENFPLSCASLGGTLVWASCLYGVVVVSSFKQYLLHLHIQVSLQVSCLVSCFACRNCISCIFIVVSLSFIVTLWIVISFIYLYLV